MQGQNECAQDRRETRWATSGLNSLNADKETTASMVLLNTYPQILGLSVLLEVARQTSLMLGETEMPPGRGVWGGTRPAPCKAPKSMQPHLALSYSVAIQNLHRVCSILEARWFIHLYTSFLHCQPFTDFNRPPPANFPISRPEMLTSPLSAES